MTSTLPPTVPEPTPSRRKNTFAKVALIIAIAAFVLGCVPFVGFVSWLLALGAIIVSIIALTRPALPKGMAVAGLIIGALALIVGPIVAVSSVVGVLSGATIAEGSASTPAALQPTADSTPVPTDAPPSSVPSTESTPEPSEPTVAVKTKTYKGSGDKVLKVDYSDPLIITFSCSRCSSNTVLKTDSGFDTLPVNVIGAYTGTHILNTSDNSLLTRFVINADASWTLKVEDPATYGHRIKRVDVGTTVRGKGDDVIYVEDGVTDSDVQNKGEGNFVLKSYGGSDSLPVNEIGSYRGNVVLDGPAVVQVESDGSWRIHGNG